MEAKSIEQGADIDFTAPAVDAEDDRRSVDRDEIGAAHALLDYVWYELRKSPELLRAGKDLVDVLTPRRGPELLRGLGKVERESKQAVDAAYEDAGFSIETVELQTLDGERTYPTTYLFRPGDVYRKRALVFSHGYTAGYESQAGLLDSDLTDFTIAIVNRSGVDPEAVRPMLHDYDPERYFLEQMYGYQQATQITLERGADEAIQVGHSMAAMLARKNVHMRHKWSPELKQGVIGTVQLNGPESDDVLENTPFRMAKPVVRSLVDILARAAAKNGSGEEHWQEELEGAPEMLRRTGRFSAESIAKTIASLAIIDRMLGDGVDPLIYAASKHRAKHTDWRTLAVDLHCMSHAPAYRSQDNLVGLNHLIIEGQFDRLVLPGTGVKLARQLSTLETTGERNTAYRRIKKAGHFPHASHRRQVNREIYEFAADPVGYTEAA